jgi:hypothetical protein
MTVLGYTLGLALFLVGIYAITQLTIKKENGHNKDLSEGN